MSDFLRYLNTFKENPTEKAFENLFAIPYFQLKKQNEQTDWYEPVSYFVVMIASLYEVPLDEKSWLNDIQSSLEDNDSKGKQVLALIHLLVVKPTPSEGYRLIYLEVLIMAFTEMTHEPNLKKNLQQIYHQIRQLKNTRFLRNIALGFGFICAVIGIALILASFEFSISALLFAGMVLSFISIFTTSSAMLTRVKKINNTSKISLFHIKQTCQTLIFDNDDDYRKLALPKYHQVSEISLCGDFTHYKDWAGLFQLLQEKHSFTTVNVKEGCLLTDQQQDDILQITVKAKLV